MIKPNEVLIAAGAAANKKSDLGYPLGGRVMCIAWCGCCFIVRRKSEASTSIVIWG